MRKFITILLVLTTAILLICGCSPKKADNTQKKMTVGFIYIGPVGDGGWTYAHDQGRLFLEKETGVKTIIKESVNEGPEVKDVIRNMVDQGCSVIFATSFGYMDYTAEISKEFPEVKFMHCSGYKMTDNMGNYFGRMYEARYLSGIVAGLKTKTNKLGYVGAFEIPEVIRGINAFTLGVKSVNPKAEVHVRWTHTWYDPAKEKQAAVALLDDGCDVIAQHQDTAGPQQAAEERNVWSVGYNSDMSALAPKAYLTGPVWNWGIYYVDQINKIKAGTWKPEAYWGGLKENIVALSPLTSNAPSNAQSVVQDAADAIRNGKLHVFSGKILDQAGDVKVAPETTLSDKELLSMDWFVNGVVGKIESN
jgi:basic membrane protein A